MDDDLKLAGIKPPPRAADDEDGDDFELYEENVESWGWFIRMNRRWIFSPMSGQRIRLDDQAIQVQFDIFGVKPKKRRKLMDDLLAMEAAALEAFPPPPSQSP